MVLAVASCQNGHAILELSNNHRASEIRELTASNPGSSVGGPASWIRGLGEEAIKLRPEGKRSLDVTEAIRKHYYDPV